VLCCVYDRCNTYIKLGSGGRHNTSFKHKSLGKTELSYPITGLDRKLRIPEFLDNQYMKVVKLSAQRTAEPPLPLTRHPLYSFLLQVESSGRIKSMKNRNDPNGNRTHDLPACSAVPQPTSHPRTPSKQKKKYKKYTTF
jgi:hypothetical protein